MSTYVLRNRTTGVDACRIGHDDNHGLPAPAYSEWLPRMEFRALTASGAHPEWEAVRV
jgi:hypothetical protein